MNKYRRVNSSNEKCLVAHFIYIFHPESADAFSENIFKTARFSCKTGINWATSITLRSWSFSHTKGTLKCKRHNAERPRSGESGDRKEQCPEDEPMRLPTHLHEPFEKINPKAHQEEDEWSGVISLAASSIVLSTNEFGDFSKCSIISEIFKDETLLQVEKDVPVLWQRFIHQAQTGRCLVFLLLLGRLCQAIAQEHQEAINYLTSVMNIEVRLPIDLSFISLSTYTNAVRITF